jgi:hypothetical protein
MEASQFGGDVVPHPVMSTFHPKRTFGRLIVMSAIDPKRTLTTIAPAPFGLLV